MSDAMQLTIYMNKNVVAELEMPPDMRIPSVDEYLTFKMQGRTIGGKVHEVHTRFKMEGTTVQGMDLLIYLVNPSFDAY